MPADAPIVLAQAEVDRVDDLLAALVGPITELRAVVPVAQDDVGAEAVGVAALRVGQLFLAADLLAELVLRERLDHFNALEIRVGERAEVALHIVLEHDGRDVALTIFLDVEQPRWMVLGDAHARRALSPAIVSGVRCIRMPTVPKFAAYFVMTDLSVSRLLSRQMRRTGSASFAFTGSPSTSGSISMPRPHTPGSTLDTYRSTISLTGLKNPASQIFEQSVTSVRKLRSTHSRYA
jgi:hypothetical protein